MSARIVYLSAVSALVISACATSQENPNYKFNTKYKAATPQTTQTASHTYASTGASSVQPVTYAGATTSSQPAVYSASHSTGTTAVQPAAYSSTTYSSTGQTASSSPIVYQSARIPSLTQATMTERSAAVGSSVATYSRVDESCLKRETRNELIGGALGGTAGAFAGEKLVGGTKGALLGAAIGGTAGYGLGDKSVNCDPISIPAVQSTTITQPYHQAATYQSQPQVHYQQTQPVPQTQYSQPQTQYGTTYASTTAPLKAPIVVQPPAPPSYSAPAYTAPTDQAYGETFGTPGYHAVMAAQGQASVQTQPQTALPAEAYLPIPPSTPAPQTAYLPQQIQQQPSYAAPQTLYQTSQVPVGAASNNMHLVVEGNTVYSLSRQICVEPSEIQQINGLDAAFNIKLGQYLRMPASRC